jgi:hypothetical protein
MEIFDQIFILLQIFLSFFKLNLKFIGFNKVYKN